jgi:tRNA threonylcarbamoyladenosine biosynthesis protein TsaB
MYILTIRSDKPEAELGLFNDKDKLDYEIWQAHRELSSTIHVKIKDLLDKQSLDLKDLGGIVVYRGPGSFTGLRIGIAVANALAYGLSVPIVGSLEEAWISQGVDKILNKENEKVVKPEYGALPDITTPKK